MNKKRVLILNGSPHKDGNTSYIVNKFISRIENNFDICELFLYDLNIKSCFDCRYCWSHYGCSIRDDMDIIYKEDYDIIVIASPIYMCNLTPPFVSLTSRLNYKWCNKHFLNKDVISNSKKGVLILTGGGSGKPDMAINTSKIIFKLLDVSFDDNYIYSFNTDNVLAKDDKNLDILIDKVVNNIEYI